MAYTFMDDYGDEWAIITDNPYYLHHQLIELSPEVDELHEVIGDQCYNGKHNWCHFGRTRAVVWSEIMAKTDAETENSCNWQWAILKRELNQMLDKIYGIEDEDEYLAAKDAWDKLSNARWFAFYQKYPEHHKATDFMGKYVGV